MIIAIEINKRYRYNEIRLLSVYTDSHVIAPSLKSWYVVGFFVDVLSFKLCEGEGA